MAVDVPYLTDEQVEGLRRLFMQEADMAFTDALRETFSDPEQMDAMMAGEPFKMQINVDLPTALKAIAHAAA